MTSAVTQTWITPTPTSEPVPEDLHNLAMADPLEPAIQILDWSVREAESTAEKTVLVDVEPVARYLGALCDGVNKDAFKDFWDGLPDESARILSEWLEEVTKSGTDSIGNVFLFGASALRWGTVGARMRNSFARFWHKFDPAKARMSVQFMRVYRQGMRNNGARNVSNMRAMNSEVKKSPWLAIFALILAVAGADLVYSLATGKTPELTRLWRAMKETAGDVASGVGSTFRLLPLIVIGAIAILILKK